MRCLPTSLGLHDTVTFNTKPAWKELYSREQFLLKVQGWFTAELRAGWPCRSCLACLLWRNWLVNFFSASSPGCSKLLLQNCTLPTPWNIQDISSRDPDQFTDLLLCFLTQVLLWGSWLGGLIWRNVESTCFIQGCFLCELVTTQSKKSLVSKAAGSLILGPKPPALVALMQ